MPILFTIFSILLDHLNALSAAVNSAAIRSTTEWATALVSFGNRVDARNGRFMLAVWTFLQVVLTGRTHTLAQQRFLRRTQDSLWVRVDFACSMPMRWMMAFGFLVMLAGSIAYPHANDLIMSAGMSIVVLVEYSLLILCAIVFDRIKIHRAISLMVTLLASPLPVLLSKVTTYLFRPPKLARHAYHHNKRGL